MSSPAASSALASAADAFYEPLSDGVYRASAATIGPWDASLQHGGPPAALLGRALETLGGPAGARIARLTIDFFSPVPVSELAVQSEVVRPGNRIQLSTATMRAGSRIVMRAAAWHLRAEGGRSPAVPADYAVPPLPAIESIARFRDLPRFPYGDAIEWRFVDGAFDTFGPATVWTRSRIPLVRGAGLSGLERVLIVADAANGISSVLPLTAWTFVPVDLTLVVERLPVAEWVGMTSRTTVGSDGLGMTDTRVFDAEGAFGRALQTLYVAPR